VNARELITGTWRGEYSYEMQDDGFLPPGAGFTMQLRAGWLFGRITGSCIDDDPTLAADAPLVTGRLRRRDHHLRLVKQYRQSWVISPDGTRTLRQWLADSGIAVTTDLPPQLVYYDGWVNPDARTAEGIWSLGHRELVLDDYALPEDAACGKWRMWKTSR
jgi:hypothetical protein